MLLMVKHHEPSHEELGIAKLIAELPLVEAFAVGIVF
jgi:hypothetical protein